MSDKTILTITSKSTPDPFVVHRGGNYYFTFTAGNRVEIWRARGLLDLEKSASKHVIWVPPHDTEHSADLWAPELHCLRGRWYVYYAAAHPSRGNKSHRMFVLGGPPAGEDPCQGGWEFLGRIRGMLDRWAIDGTVFELDNTPYLVYSSWPLDNRGDSDLVQELFIARLEDPTTATAADGVPVRICRPDRRWEFTRDGNGDHGINEGPQFLGSPDGGWKGLVYSCAGSWTREYKMATLQYTGGNPMDPRSWLKGSEPLLMSKIPGRGPWGPGHGSFLVLGDQVAAVFHATDSPTDGWDNRRARVQLVTFTNDGPFMGRHIGADHAPSLVATIKMKILGDKYASVDNKDSLGALLGGK